MKKNLLTTGVSAGQCPPLPPTFGGQCPTLPPSMKVPLPCLKLVILA